MYIRSDRQGKTAHADHRAGCSKLKRGTYISKRRWLSTAPLRP